MSFELRITGATMQDLKESTAEAFVFMSSQDAVAAKKEVDEKKEPPKRRGRKTKAEKEAEAKAAEEAKEPDPEPESEPEKELEIGDVRDAIHAYCLANEKANPDNDTAQREAMLEVLEHVDAGKLSAIDEADYQKAIDFANAQREKLEADD